MLKYSKNNNEISDTNDVDIIPTKKALKVIICFFNFFEPKKFTTATSSPNKLIIRTTNV